MTTSMMQEVTAAQALLLLLLEVHDRKSTMSQERRALRAWRKQRPGVRPYRAPRPSSSSSSTPSRPLHVGELELKLVQEVIAPQPHLASMRDVPVPQPLLASSGPVTLREELSGKETLSVGSRFG